MLTGKEAAFLGADEGDAERLCPCFGERNRDNWIHNFMMEVERLHAQFAAEQAKEADFERASTVEELKDWIREHLL